MSERVHHATGFDQLQSVARFTVVTTCGVARYQLATGNWRHVTCQKCRRVHREQQQIASPSTDRRRQQ
jgi:hypothetical protein